MRCLLSTGAVVLLVGSVAGCRSQSTAMTNPFLAPDRVPPPATRTLLPGTAQPYYPGDPVPNSPTIGTPPAGFVPRVAPQPGLSPTIPTFAPQPAGALPPGGWNGTPQPIPQGSSARNVLPSSIQPASTGIANAALLPVAPPQVSPYPNQVALSQSTQLQPAPQLQQTSALSQPREVRIRAISSDNLDPSNGQPRTRDGFRPQRSSNHVRKPVLANHLQLRKPAPQHLASDRFGFDPKYGWLRGQLEQSPADGQWTLDYGAASGGEKPFGGRLAIANPHVLGNLQSGDYVQLRGRVEASTAGNAAPTYLVSVVRRQRI